MKKSICSSIGKISVAILIGVMICSLNVIQVKAAQDGLTATEMVADMNVGWSLGNSLNTHDNHTAANNNKIEHNSVDYYEMMWWNPKTTKQMIETVKAAGFNTLRIPVTYYNHVDKNGVIDKIWLDRVAEVVAYGLELDMYVIINVHHDTGKGADKYIQADNKNLPIYQAYLENIWTQIALYFKDYDTRLVFEAMNETLDMSANNPWYGNESSWNAMNKLNQAFVNVVRAIGGRNSTRNLLVNTYGAQTTNGPMENFEIPKDTVKNHLIVGVHTYATSEQEIKGIMGTLNWQFVRKGYPVIIGEFGTPYWDNLHSRMVSAIHFMNYGNMYGIKCIWWDDGGNYKLFDRNTNTWKYPQIVNAMMYAIAVSRLN